MQDGKKKLVIIDMMQNSTWYLRAGFRNFLLLFFLSLLSSVTSFSQKVAQWDRYEVVLQYVYKGNSFTDVQLSARFSNKDSFFIIPGFYDGNNKFKIRFMPEKTGSWQYETISNIKQLNHQKGSLTYSGNSAFPSSHH